MTTGTRVAVTGAAGLQGSALCNLLVQGGYEVVAIDCRDMVQESCTRAKLDIVQEPGKLLEALEGCSVVFHLAAQLASHAEIAADSSIAFGNANIDRALLQALSWLTDRGFASPTVDSAAFSREPSTGPVHLVYASSGCVYPPKTEGRYGEEEAPIAPLPLPGDCSYGTQKIVTEFALRNQSYVTSTCLRMFNVYGPGAREGNLVYDLVKKVLDAPAGEPVSTYGKLNARRPLLYVEDAARAYMAAMERRQAGGLPSHVTVNIGAADSISIQGILEKIMKLNGSSDPQVYGDTGDVPEKTPCIDKAERLLGWRPETSLDAGLASTFPAMIYRMSSW